MAIYKKTSFFLILGGIWGLYSFGFGPSFADPTDVGLFGAIMTFPTWIVFILDEASPNGFLFSWDILPGSGRFELDLAVLLSLALGMMIFYGVKKILIK